MTVDKEQPKISIEDIHRASVQYNVARLQELKSLVQERLNAIGETNAKVEADLEKLKQARDVSSDEVVKEVLTEKIEHLETVLKPGESETKESLQKRLDLIDHRLEELVMTGV